MRVDINFEASGFVQDSPLNGPKIPPPIDFISGSFSFLIQDPEQHFSFFVAHNVTPVNFDLTLGGVTFSASDIAIQYRLFRNQFVSFSAGADLDGPGNRDHSSSITSGTTDFWIGNHNNSSDFSYWLSHVNALYSTDNIIFDTQITNVDEPHIGMAFLLLSIMFCRRKLCR
ncbi:hypothetical protein [Agaribacter marinus]|uniref:hypothetical protein n=1 Tax=Agaribacter marinus TaxID=1431249 RepID=UPI0024E09C6A|nr:hypothetical protein [Agaribacter marinus]